jgi:hypothetical protein
MQNDSREDGSGHLRAARRGGRPAAGPSRLRLMHRSAPLHAHTGARLRSLLHQKSLRGARPKLAVAPASAMVVFGVWRAACRPCRRPFLSVPPTLISIPDSGPPRQAAAACNRGLCRPRTGGGTGRIVYRFSRQNCHEAYHGAPLLRNARPVRRERLGRRRRPAARAPAKPAKPRLRCGSRWCCCGAHQSPGGDCMCERSVRSSGG